MMEQLSLELFEEEQQRILYTFRRMRGIPAPCLQGKYCSYAPYERCALNCKDYPEAGLCFGTCTEISYQKPGFCSECEHGTFVGTPPYGDVHYRCDVLKFPYGFWISHGENTTCQFFEERK